MQIYYTSILVESKEVPTLPNAEAFPLTFGSDIQFHISLLKCPLTFPFCTRGIRTLSGSEILQVCLLSIILPVTLLSHARSPLHQNALQTSSANVLGLQGIQVRNVWSECASLKGRGVVRQLKTRMGQELTEAQLLMRLTYLNCQLCRSQGEAGEKVRAQWKIGVLRRQTESLTR